MARSFRMNKLFQPFTITFELPTGLNRGMGKRENEELGRLEPLKGARHATRSARRLRLPDPMPPQCEEVKFNRWFSVDLKHPKTK
ncbi:hypothetical protein L6452_18631 [Arctium lappa]|uniref:Uncharacterized protein n=1 Tax=Arctium lappa TaxID=4217 RepID=A0ACB9C6V3_ARCLA|nr:hypothetical protein L6452_18631 [Arctium lappa]